MHDAFHQLHLNADFAIDSFAIVHDTNSYDVLDDQQLNSTYDVNDVEEMQNRLVPVHQVNLMDVIFVLQLVMVDVILVFD